MPTPKVNVHQLGGTTLMDSFFQFPFYLSAEESRCANSHLPHMEVEKQPHSQSELGAAYDRVQGNRQGDSQHYYIPEIQEKFQASYGFVVKIRLVQLMLVGFYCPILFLFFFIKVVHN